MSTKPPSEEVLAPSLDQAVYTSTEPEYVGRIPVRTELTVIPSAEPNHKFGFTVHHLWGSEVYPIPEGQEPSEEMADPKNILTRQDDLQEGLRLLILTLFGWSVGVVAKDEKGNLTCTTPGGSFVHFLTFANDRPPLADGTPALPRWVCTGSANLRGLKKLMVTAESPSSEVTG